MGGVLGQTDATGGKLVVLMYWSAPLSPTQSMWHPFGQEFMGLLHMKRAVVKHFGRIGISTAGVHDVGTEGC